MGNALDIRWKALPLRPEPDSTVRFKGTYVPVIAATGADMDRFLDDFDRGAGREAVLQDYEDAVVRDRVRAIPTVLVGGGQRVTGLVDLPTYRKAIAEA